MGIRVNSCNKPNKYTSNDTFHNTEIWIDVKFKNNKCISSEIFNLKAYVRVIHPSFLSTQ